MHARPSRSRRQARGPQLSFGDDFFFSLPAATPAVRDKDCRVRATVASSAGPGRASLAAEDAAARATSNAYELRACMRNSLTALTAATALLVRHAPDSKVVGELSAVMLRQIDVLAQQVHVLEAIAVHCESAPI